MSLYFYLAQPLTMELAALEGLKISFPKVFSAILIHTHLILADKQN